MKKPLDYVIVREMKEKDWGNWEKARKRLLFYLLPVLILDTVEQPAAETASWRPAEAVGEGD